MKLKKLFKDLPDATIKGSKTTEIHGLCSDSRLLAPGDLFIAKRGENYDGNDFAMKAAESGAVAILTDLFHPFLTIPQIIHPNFADIESIITDRFYSSPSKDLFSVGITGTNGKTTCCYLIKSLLDAIKKPCGLIGTIEYILGEDIIHPSSCTTPDIISNQKMLRDMLRHDCQAVALEISSHALTQDRVKGISFDVMVFTNLSQDHFDYHKTIEHYKAAKSSLFSEKYAKTGLKAPFPVAIVNADDESMPSIVKDFPGTTLTYGIENDAEVRASNIMLSSTGTSCDISYGDEEISFSWSLFGRHNIYNALTAFCCGVLLGKTLSEVSAAISSFPSVPGRLERVDIDSAASLYIDYAHTADALHKTLLALRQIAQKRIITVFGCGGNRDKEKRKPMGRIAEELSDLSIITSDNPRGEDPSIICEEISQGFTSEEKYIIQPDRTEAIRYALDIAQDGDIILLAGKGHETHQILQHQTIPFDEKHIVMKLCHEKCSTLQ
jgi:UDP-N-acetylmuramoyl-L-alanyl-D-glutamate--2,6-diaminopimelate ligase